MRYNKYNSYLKTNKAKDDMSFITVSVAEGLILGYRLAQIIGIDGSVFDKFLDDPATRDWRGFLKQLTSEQMKAIHKHCCFKERLELELHFALVDMDCIPPDYVTSSPEATRAFFFMECEEFVLLTAEATGCEDCIVRSKEIIKHYQQIIEKEKRNWTEAKLVLGL